MHANDSNRVNIHEARSRELTTSAYCDAVFCLTLQTKSKYEKQIIGRRKKREWTSVNSQTIRRIKQNNEVHCLHRQLCICAQYVQFVGIFIRNNAQSYCKHPLKLGESIFFDIYSHSPPTVILARYLYFHRLFGNHYRNWTTKYFRKIASSVSELART